MTSSMNEDNILDDRMKKVGSDMEAVRAKENRLKLEFEKQMDEIKDQAKTIGDEHHR